MLNHRATIDDSVEMTQSLLISGTSAHARSHVAVMSRRGLSRRFPQIELSRQRKRATKRHALDDATGTGVAVRDMAGVHDAVAKAATTNP